MKDPITAEKMGRDLPPVASRDKQSNKDAVEGIVVSELP